MNQIDLAVLKEVVWTFEISLGAENLCCQLHNPFVALLEKDDALWDGHGFDSKLDTFHIESNH